MTGKLLDAHGHHVADERFPPGTKVTIDDFEPGDWHVCHDWPENIPAGFERSVHIGGRSADGVVGTAWLHPSRLHVKSGGD